MPRGQPRRSLRQLIADSQRAAKLRASGLPYREIADELGISRNTAARLVCWHEDMLAAWGGFPRNRARRLPFRHGRAWDQARFDALVARRQKILELTKVDEAMSDASEATRNAEKSRRDEAREWVDAGSPPDKAPVWLRDAFTGPQ